MPAASISGLMGEIKDVDLNTEERVVLAKVLRKIADAMNKTADDLVLEAKK